MAGTVHKRVPPTTAPRRIRSRRLMPILRFMRTSPARGVSVNLSLSAISLSSLRDVVLVVSADRVSRCPDASESCVGPVKAFHVPAAARHCLAAAQHGAILNGEITHGGEAPDAILVVPALATVETARAHVG